MVVSYGCLLCQLKIVSKIKSQFWIWYCESMSKQLLVLALAVSTSKSLSQWLKTASISLLLTPRLQLSWVSSPAGRGWPVCISRLKTESWSETHDTHVDSRGTESAPKLASVFASLCFCSDRHTHAQKDRAVCGIRMHILQGLVGGVAKDINTSWATKPSPTKVTQLFS